MVLSNECAIRKIFHKDKNSALMKFTKKSLIETLKDINDGKTSYQARKNAKISVRRVYQIKKKYLITGNVPEIGKGVGRPMIQIRQEEIDLIKRFFEKYLVSADTLMRLIERDEKIHISNYRIHKILLMLGYAKKKEKKDIRKKDWIRYERRHSLTAVHIDWHYTGKMWVYAVIDDASRFILSLIECSSPTTEKSMEGMKLALKFGKIKQCISDHGAQFMNNMEGYSRFQEFLKEQKIQHIPCKIKHPQSNGKIEKWFDCYDKRRNKFKTKEEFLHWYNEIRPHRSLNFEMLETPIQAFKRKKRLNN